MRACRTSLWAGRHGRASLHRGVKGGAREMIDRQEIDAKAGELGVHTSNVQRDYVFGWLLAGLAQAHNVLQPSLVLKGGNCFRKAYFEHARFSKDLDFSTQTELGADALVEGLSQACKFAGERSGVEFLVDQSRVSERS